MSISPTHYFSITAHLQWGELRIIFHFHLLPSRFFAKDFARNKLHTKSLVRNENPCHDGSLTFRNVTAHLSCTRYMYIPSLCRPAWLRFREYDVRYEPARFEYPQVHDSQQWYRSRVKEPRGTRSNSVTHYALSNQDSFLSIYSRWISDDFIKLAASFVVITCNSLRYLSSRNGQ